MYGVSHLAVYDMANKIYGPEESRQHISGRYGFAEATNGTPQESPPDGEPWIVALSRRVAVVLAAAGAAIHRF